MWIQSHKECTISHYLIIMWSGREFAVNFTKNIFFIIELLQKHF